MRCPEGGKAFNSICEGTFPLADFAGVRLLLCFLIQRENDFILQRVEDTIFCFCHRSMFEYVETLKFTWIIP